MLWESIFAQRHPTPFIVIHHPYSTWWPNVFHVEFSTVGRCSLGRSLTLITLVCEKNRAIYLPQFNSTQPRLPLMFRGRSRGGGGWGEGVATPFSPLGSRKCRKFTVNALFHYPYFQNFLVYLAP